MKPRFYMTYFNCHDTNSHYSHPEIRVFVEEIYANKYMDGREVLSIVWQSDGDRNFSLRQSYAPRITTPLCYERRYAKKLLSNLLDVEYPNLKALVKILHKNKVEKRRYMDVGKGDSIYAREAVPVKFSQFATLWYKAKESGKEISIGRGKR